MTDASRPNVARIYDYLLGGSNNFPVDRAAADEVVRLQPLAARSVRENRDFLIRAARHLAAEAGIRQFLDIGAGLPTMDNVHEVVRRVVPDARVAYVDHNPEVVKHAESLIDGTDGVGVVEADIRAPASTRSRRGQRRPLAPRPTTARCRNGNVRRDRGRLPRRHRPPSSTSQED